MPEIVANNERLLFTIYAGKPKDDTTVGQYSRAMEQNMEEFEVNELSSPNCS
jgi:hypothetical protein